jgi:hypothetical protein
VESMERAVEVMAACRANGKKKKIWKAWDECALITMKNGNSPHLVLQSLEPIYRQHM